MVWERAVSNEIPLLKDGVIAVLIHRPTGFRHRLKAKNWGEFRRFRLAEEGFRPLSRLCKLRYP
jgi:hypothetical protein